MKLTPLDIHHKEFRGALRGYNEKEVDQFLDEVADEYERLFKENVDLNERLQATLDRIKSYEDMKETLQNTLLVAQKHAEDVESDAAKRSELMVREADLRAQQIVGDALAEKQRVQQEVLRIRKAEDQYRESMTALLEGHMKELDEVPVPEDFPTVADVEATQEKAADVASRPPSDVPPIEPSSAGTVPGHAEPAPAPEPVAPTPEAAETTVMAAAAWGEPAEPAPAPAWGAGVAAPPVPEPIVPEPAPAAAAPVPGTQAAAESEVPGAPLGATSLTLGEVAPPGDIGMEAPAFTDPAEFQIPRFGESGQAESDADIEEID